MNINKDASTPNSSTSQRRSPGQTADKDDDDDNDNDNDDATSLHTISEPASEPGHEPDGSDSEYIDNANISKMSKPKSFTEKIREAALSAKNDPNGNTNDNHGDHAKPRQPTRRARENKEKDKKPQARKVNPEAHANYRALRIRNKGSKARSFGRFRR